MFKGSMVAMVTPMRQGEVDLPRLRALVDFHIEAGTDAIVAAGTTGESGALSLAEKHLVIKTVVEEVRERIPVIAGTAMNATRDCIELTHKAMELGAHAALIMTPAYIKPTQAGLIAHYTAIAEAVPMPIIMYNVPGRTACDLLPETAIALSKISNIIGIKEATGQIERLEKIIEGSLGALDVYSGDDATAALWMLNGARGDISVTANVAPKLMAKMCSAALDGDEKTALELDAKLRPLHELLFLESNPIPAKWSLGRMGLIEDELRLPLTSLSAEHHLKLEEALSSLALI